MFPWVPDFATIIIVINCRDKVLFYVSLLADPKHSPAKIKAKEVI